MDDVVNSWHREVQAGLDVLRHSEILHTNAGLRSAHYTGERGHRASRGFDCPCEQSKIGFARDGVERGQGCENERFGAGERVRRRTTGRVPANVWAEWAVAHERTAPARRAS